MASAQATPVAQAYHTPVATAVGGTPCRYGVVSAACLRLSPPGLPEAGRCCRQNCRFHMRYLQHGRPEDKCPCASLPTVFPRSRHRSLACRREQVHAPVAGRAPRPGGCGLAPRAPALMLRAQHGLVMHHPCATCFACADVGFAFLQFGRLLGFKRLNPLNRRRRRTSWHRAFALRAAS